MNNDRFEYFKNLTYEQKLDLTFDDFTTTEILEIVKEMRCKTECKDIAIMYYVECLSLEQIADKIGIDYRTVSNRLKKILFEFKMTCIKIFFKPQGA